MPSNCETPLTSLKPFQKDAFKVAFGIVAVTATALNAAVLGIFIKEKSSRTFCNALLMSLLVSDILVSSVLSPLTVTRLSLPPEEALCTINTIAFLVASLLATSAFTVAAVAYDRYHFITRTNQYQELMTTRRKVALIVIPWLAPLVIIPARLTDDNVFTWILFGLYVVCYCVLIGSYMRLIRSLSLRLSRVNHFDCDVAGKYSRLPIMRQNQKVTRLILLVTVTFILCTLVTLSYRILLTVNLYTENGWKFFEDHGPFVHAMGSLMFQLISALNPIIYFAKHQDIKRFLRRIIRSRSSSVSP